MTTLDHSACVQVGAPLSGNVVEVRVSTGSRVLEGDPIAVLSAMKMEVTVHAPHEGTVGSVDVVVGDSVTAGDLVAQITGK